MMTLHHHDINRGDPMLGDRCPASDVFNNEVDFLI